MTCQESGKHQRPVHFNRRGGSKNHVWACCECGKQLAGPKLPEDELQALVAVATRDFDLLKEINEPKKDISKAITTAALDLETACGVEGCPGYGLSNSSKCDHAVHHKLNQIKIIGTWDGTNYIIHPTPSAFDKWRTDNRVQLVTHGGKFDYKTLKAKGSNVSPRDFIGDTQLMAASLRKKVPKDWLKEYNEERKMLNEELPPGAKHRVGSPLTLKVIAPYYLGVPKFWENPASHDDPEYNRKDCEYTLMLYEKFVGLLESDGTKGFYENFLLPWSKLLAEAEYEGVLIDETKLHQMYQEALTELAKLEDEVHKECEECFAGYLKSLIDAEVEDSVARAQKYIDTRLKDKSKAPGIWERYAASCEKKISELPTKFNLQSNQQMLYVLNYFGIDTNIDKRDKETNEWVESEGTDKFVLKRAKVRDGSEFATRLLALRSKQTEVTYLKQYIEATVDGRIHCGFNITGTRTGRLSSSGPNLQNVKGSLRLPFIIADPDKYSIYTVDSSQIEPRVVAYLTADREMVHLFVEGRDYHNYATKKFFPDKTQGVHESEIKKAHSGLRKTAKIGDLSILYGTGPYTFQTMCLVREEMDLSLDECKLMVNTFKNGMGGVFGWKARLEDQYRGGHPVQDMFGYPVEARDQGSIHMTLFNTFVQGMASRMIFHASLLAFRRFSKLKIDAKPLLWVHDEVVWRFPKGKEKFCQDTVDYYMKAYRLETPHGQVPLEVEGHMSDRWNK